MVINKITQRFYPANPATEAARFQKAVEEAHEFSKKWDRDVIIFKNDEGNFFIRELFLSEPAIVQLYVALKKFNCNDKRRQQIAWRRVNINDKNFVPRQKRDYSDGSK